MINDGTVISENIRNNIEEVFGFKFGSKKEV